MASPDLLAPADSASPLEPSAPTRWHLIVGILSAVYAAAGMLMWLGLLAVSIFWRQMMSAARMGDIEFPPAVRIFNIASSAVLVVLGVLMLAGGILLAMRRPLGASLLRFWAVARLAVILVGLVAGFAFLGAQVDLAERIAVRQREILTEANQDPNAVQIPERATAERNARYQLGGLSVVTAAFPLFLAILLTSRRKREEIDAWGAAIR